MPNKRSRAITNGEVGRSDIDVFDTTIAKVSTEWKKKRVSKAAGRRRIKKYWSQIKASLVDEPTQRAFRGLSTTTTLTAGAQAQVTDIFPWYSWNGAADAFNNDMSSICTINSRKDTTVATIGALVSGYQAYLFTMCHVQIFFTATATNAVNTSLDIYRCYAKNDYANLGNNSILKTQTITDRWAGAAVSETDLGITPFDLAPFTSVYTILDKKSVDIPPGLTNFTYEYIDRKQHLINGQDFVDESATLTMPIKKGLTQCVILVYKNQFTPTAGASTSISYTFKKTYDFKALKSERPSLTIV